MQRAYIPSAIARQPWGVIVPLTALVTFGGAVLYSAAGGHFQPWAFMHVARFFVFLAMAMLIARVPQAWFRNAALPSYAVLCVLLVLVELLGRISGGSQRAFCSGLPCTTMAWGPKRLMWMAEAAA